MTESNQSRGDRIKTRSVLQLAHMSKHEVVSVTLAEFLQKPSIERTGYYFIGIAFHGTVIREVFSSDDNLFWVMINFRTGFIVMQGNKETEPDEKECERIQLSVGEVCFVYNRDILYWT